MLFSEREKIEVTERIVINKIEQECKNRIYNSITKYFNDSIEENEQNELYMLILDRMGIKIERQILEYESYYLTESLQQLFDDCWESVTWNKCFDILELIISYQFKDPFARNNKLSFIANLNEILEQEKSAYRIISDIVVCITTKEELFEVEKCLNNPYTVIKESMEKALLFYSDREKPDYKNSIKESITAVESMCCIICNDDSVTLGQALGKLESNGVYLHGAMKAAFNSLYGYTSDTTGIRHGGINDSKVTSEDARYMLISCSAFVNYLHDKYSKIGE